MSMIAGLFTPLTAIKASDRLAQHSERSGFFARVVALHPEGKWWLFIRTIHRYPR